MPYLRVTLAARFNLRIENMTAADVMNVKCYGCGNVTRIAAHQLLCVIRGHPASDSDNIRPPVPI